MSLRKFFKAMFFMSFTCLRLRIVLRIGLISGLSTYCSIDHNFTHSKSFDFSKEKISHFQGQKSMWNVMVIQKRQGLNLVPCLGSWLGDKWFFFLKTQIHWMRVRASVYQIANRILYLLKLSFKYYTFHQMKGLLVYHYLICKASSILGI